MLCFILAYISDAFRHVVEHKFANLSIYLEASVVLLNSRLQLTRFFF